ncbi:MAG: ATP-binding protein [Actinomycetia bacterium]|nr:ATP-binding protein [Actinomycetes bacterium]
MQYIHRKLSDELIKWLGRREILAIRGPRQSGKTTLLEYLSSYIKESKNTLPENVVYISFEDRKEVDNFSKDPKSFTDAYINGDFQKRYYFLFDEFQYIKNGGQKLKLLYDTYKNVKFIITGSSSLELTGSTAKYLVGRIFLLNLYQFDFEEYLYTKPKNILNHYRKNSSLVLDFIFNGKKAEEFSSIFTEDFIKFYEEYCIFGGYPEVVKTGSTQTKKIILENIYNTYIDRDIIILLRIEDDFDFKNILTILANQIGNIINYQSLDRDSLTYYKKLKHYLSILEETFIMRRLGPYYTNISSEIRKNPKLYFIDNGLRNLIIENFNEFSLRKDKGSLVENTVFLQLFKNKFTLVRYWRTIHGAEVDFVIKIGENLIPIEVKYTNFTSTKPGRSFINFVKKYKHPRGLVLTKGFWGETKINKTDVLFAPVWFI